MNRVNDLIEHVRRIALATGHDIALDRDLLAAFVVHQDEAAFEALVIRHGPMVLNVCRCLLQNHHDAEDAFQAAFLVLARKAASVRPRHMVGNWLYGVAYRTALEARTVRRRRLGRQRSLADFPEPAATPSTREDELQQALHEELHRLPEHYRAVIVLCDLEGKTQKEAARQLSCPPGTVSCRLARGRRLLAKRLGRHGLALSAGAAALALSSQTTFASLTTPLVASAVKTATAISGGAPAISVVSARVLNLSQGVLTKMLFARLRITVAVMAAMASVGIGASLLAISPGVPRQTAVLPALPHLAPSASAGRPEGNPGGQPRFDLYGDPLPSGALARFGTVRFRHAGCSGDRAEFLADGRTIVTGGEDGKVRFWDAASGKLRRTLGVLECEIWCMALAPDGRRCAVGGPAGAAVWDLELGKRLQSLHGGAVCGLAFSPNGKTLVAGGENFDATLRVYDLVTGKELRQMSWHDHPVSRILVGSDNRTLVSVNLARRTVHVGDLDSGKELRTLTSKNWGGLNAAELLPDGRTLLVAGHRAANEQDGMMEIYDLATGRRLRVLEGPAKVTGVGLLPGGKELIALDSGGAVRRWDLAAWKTLAPLPGPGCYDRISPDGHTGLRCAGDALALYDLATGKPQLEFDGHTGVVESLVFSRDGTLLASVQSGNDTDIRVWEVAKSKTVRKLIGHPAHLGSICGILGTAEGFLTGGSDGTIRLWDGASGKQLRLLRLTSDEQVRTMAVSVDGQHLLCTASNFGIGASDRTINVVDLATWNLLIRRQDIGERRFPNTRYFAPDGRSFVKSCQQGLVRVQTATGKELVKYTASDILEEPVAFTPDGRSLAVRSYTEKLVGPRYQHIDRKLRVFDTETGQQRFVINCPGWQQPLAFAPDGQLLAAAADQVLVLFNATNGQERWRSPELDSRIAAMAFAPDGRTLATSQRDGTILIWDTAEATRHF